MLFIDIRNNSDSYRNE